MIDKLQTFGGRVEEVTPTSVVASFGVDPVEDAPRRAAHAAMVIHKRAERAREDKSRTPGVKIGIHVAQVLVGRSASRIDIDAEAKRAQGPVLDQLLQTIGPDETVASAAAAPFLERRFELVPIDGGAGGAGPVLSPHGAGTPGVGAVGRDDEVRGASTTRSRSCGAAWPRRGMGRASSWRSSGSPGWASRASSGSSPTRRTSHGWLVLEAGAVPYGKTTPYLPVIDLLKAYCGIGERDDQRAIREKVTGKLLVPGPGVRGRPAGVPDPARPPRGRPGVAGARPGRAAAAYPGRRQAPPAS